MIAQDNGGPAFPNNASDAWGGPEEGMTLRDWVMGQCIASYFGGNSEPLDIKKDETEREALARYWADVAVAAAIAADAMIAARKGGAK